MRGFVEGQKGEHTGEVVVAQPVPQSLDQRLPVVVPLIDHHGHGTGAASLQCVDGADQQ
ncbi:hypothetical protein [Streptomyces lavenduligriseus]|uniref:hypothetical protein n=1 Tax=Streptomyces lavenduligriseus TaxID=67315 RepID=UPI001FD7641A|nr:hypothetical protein [Streptomyces lavenduligriseus]